MDLMWEEKGGQCEDLAALRASLSEMTRFAKDLGDAAEGRRRAPLEESAFVPVALGMIARDSAAPDLEIQTNSDDTVLTVAVPLDLLCSLLGELVRNASLAGASTVSISAMANGHFVRFEIEDNGNGLSAETLESAIEPFSDPQKGQSGVNLTRLASILTDEGETLSLASTEGEGTLVTFRLPVESVSEGNS